MGIKQVVQDDMDGSTLPDDTKPTTIKVGSESYDVYLSDDSLSKLVKMLSGDGPITTVETTYGRKSKSTKTTTVDKSDAQAARHWAMETGYSYTDAQGKERTIGTKGKVPEKVVQAWRDAGSPGIGV